MRSRRSLALGVLLAALMAAAMLLAAKPAHAQSTFTVTNTNDSGTGSLRQAIRDANATTAADTIDFNIPTTTTNGVATISPANALPTITSPVTINGYSQPGAEPNSNGNDADLKIELSGQHAGSGATGLQIEAANSTVKGLVVNRWGQMGILVFSSDATGNKVVGNYVGTDASGTQDLGNSFDGVVIYDAPNNTIGGATAGERNVISGNNGDGVYIEGDTATGNKVIGNYVGTDESGTQDLGNSSSGVFVSDLLTGGAPNNTVGGATAGERNIISGNEGSGIAIRGAGVSDNKVVGNYVGTDKSGTQDLGNSSDGVLIYDAPNNTIGGATAGERNVISGNGWSGIDITGVDASGNKVIGNYVGTDESGTQDLGNSGQGVFIYGPPNNTIGGATTGERNIISGNEGSGISIAGDTATGNKVAGNYVGTDKSGTQDLGNSSDGVIITAPNNTIGGAKTGERNVVFANGRRGVFIIGDTATGNRVLSNSIFANEGLGIDLVGTNGPTANDAGDADLGPNLLQNFPEINSAKPTTVRKVVRKKKKKRVRYFYYTTIVGTLNSTPSGTFTVQVFANPSGTDEGKTPIGQASVTTDANGDGTFGLNVARAAAPVESAITATATDADGNTSELSAPKTVAVQ